MMLDLVIKMVMTAAVVITVTLLVGRLGPRIGGIVAGTPIVIGPAFYFLGREQTSAFVGHAAVSTLHALASSLLFLMCFVGIAERFSAYTCVLVSVTVWAIASAIFVQWMPVGLWPALALYALIFGAALIIERHLNLTQHRPISGRRWRDLIVRGLTAGALVGVTTTIGARSGPTLSGTLAGFPVGFVVISLTLHQRFGPSVARATLAAAQRGMSSLVVFASVVALTVSTLGGMGAFSVALAASLAASVLMVFMARIPAITK